MAERQALGIDIHEFARTGGINYDLVNGFIQGGVYDFLIIKAGLGTRKSPLFDEQRENVERLDIPYVTYHFLDPRVDMKEQARQYVNWVGKGQPNYILDIESPAPGVDVVNKAQIITNINELAGLVGKQPILYSSWQILTQIGFVDEARKYRLWIAQYLWDPAKSTDTDKVLYRSFEDFVRDQAGRLPPSVVNTVLEDNVILWQFTSKGDGRRYIYNATTKDPKFTQGMLSADLNISIKGRSEFMQFMFGRVPEIKEGAEIKENNAVVPETQPGEPTYPGKTNQDMINAIFKAAEPHTDHPWEDWVVRAHLESLADPSENRTRPYTGPRIEVLPNLSDAEKSAILAALGMQPVTPQEESAPAGPKVTFTPSGQAIARCVGDLNKAGKPIWAIYPRDSAPPKQRIFFKTPIEVEPVLYKGDGGKQCYKLISSPVSVDLYVRVEDGVIS